jgi:hypothetical protein
MKYFTLLIALVISSCSSDTAELSQIQNLNGSWQLMEILEDPGDGSGQFQSTNLNVTLVVEDNDKVIANGILCGFSESVEWFQGTLIMPDSVITTPCQNGELKHHVQLKTPYLILSNMSCREPCRAKFIKIN